MKWRENFIKCRLNQYLSDIYSVISDDSVEQTWPSNQIQRKLELLVEIFPLGNFLK